MSSVLCKLHVANEDATGRTFEGSLVTVLPIEPFNGMVLEGLPMGEPRYKDGNQNFIVECVIWEVCTQFDCSLVVCIAPVDKDDYRERTVEQIKEWLGHRWEWED